MTDKEHDTLSSLIRQIREELQKNRDELQDAIVVSYIELVLNFCQRFYNRQFMTRKLESSDVLVRFNNLLRNYFEEKLQLTLGFRPYNIAPISSVCPLTISEICSRK